MRARTAAVLLGLVSMVALGLALPIAAIEPHEDPDSAPWVFDGVSLLQKYSAALDFVLRRDAAGVAALQDQATRANIPPEIRETVAGFLGSGYPLARLFSEIEADLEDLRTLVAQFRPEEAKLTSEAAAQKVNQAYRELRAMEKEATDTGRWWQADTAPEGSPLRAAYAEVNTKLLRVRSLLDLFRGMRLSLARQAEIVGAVSEGDIGRFLELRELLRQQGMSQEALERLSELKGAALRSTAMTLNVEPGTAFVGDRVAFRGTLIAGEEPLGGRQVTLLRDGSPAVVAVTDGTGAYQGEVVLPYQYVPEMALQALYYPQGADLGLFLGSTSPELTITVLFYETRWAVQVPGETYPGRTLVLTGRLDYGANPAAELRSLLVYWDGELATEETVATAFTLEVPVPEKASLGRHRVTLHMAPQERYAPAWFSTQLEVIKAAPVIEVQAPGVVLLPLAVDIRGKVYSNLGPFQNASLTIGLGGQEVTAVTLEDGTFGGRLPTGLSLTLVGTQQLRVRVTPGEPWHKAGESAVGLLVVNPVNMAGLALGLLALTFWGVHRARRRGPGGARAAPQPAPALVRTEPLRPRAGMPVPEAKGGPRTILLALYRAVLRLVQRVTAVALRPSHTLREFAQECAPRLGPFAGHFRELTLMIEGLLYSPQPPSEADAARGRELSRRLEEGLEDENA